MDEKSQGYMVPSVSRGIPSRECSMNDRQPIHSMHPHMVAQLYPYPYSHPGEPYSRGYMPPNDIYGQGSTSSKSHSQSRSSDRPGTSRSVVVTRVGPAEVLGSSSAMASQTITSLPNAAHPEIMARQNYNQNYNHPLVSSQSYSQYFCPDKYVPSTPTHPSSGVPSRSKTPTTHRSDTSKASPRRTNKITSSTASLIRAEAPTTLGESLGRDPDIWNPGDSVVYGRTCDPVPHKDLLSDCAYIKRVENPYGSHRPPEPSHMLGEHQIYKYRNEAFPVKFEELRKCNGVKEARHEHLESREEDVLDLSLKTVRQSADSTEPDSDHCQPLQLTTTKSQARRLSPGALHSQDSNGVSASTSHVPSPNAFKRSVESSVSNNESNAKYVRTDEPGFHEVAPRRYDIPFKGRSYAHLQDHRSSEFVNKYPNLSVASHNASQSLDMPTRSPTQNDKSISPYANNYYLHPESQKSQYTSQYSGQSYRPSSVESIKGSPKSHHPEIPASSNTQRRHVVLDPSLYRHTSVTHNPIPVLNKPSRPSSADRSKIYQNRVDEPSNSKAYKSQKQIDATLHCVSPVARITSDGQNIKKEPVIQDSIVCKKDSLNKGNSINNFDNVKKENIVSDSVRPIDTGLDVSDCIPVLCDKVGPHNTVTHRGESLSDPKVSETLSNSSKIEIDKTIKNIYENSTENDSIDKASSDMSYDSGKENKLPSECTPASSSDGLSSKTDNKQYEDSNSGETSKLPVSDLSSSVLQVARVLNLSKGAVNSDSKHQYSRHESLKNSSHEPEILDLGTRTKHMEAVTFSVHGTSESLWTPSSSKHPLNLAVSTPPTSWDAAQSQYLKTSELVPGQRCKDPSYNSPQYNNGPAWAHHDATYASYKDVYRDPVTVGHKKYHSQSYEKHWDPGRHSEKPVDIDITEQKWNPMNSTYSTQSQQQSLSGRFNAPSYTRSIDSNYYLPQNSYLHPDPPSTMESSRATSNSHLDAKSWPHSACSSHYYGSPYNKPIMTTSPYTSSSYNYRDEWRKKVATTNDAQHDRVTRDVSVKSLPIQSPWTPTAPHYVQPSYTDNKDKLVRPSSVPRQVTDPQSHSNRKYSVASDQATDMKRVLKNTRAPTTYPQYFNPAQQSSSYFHNSMKSFQSLYDRPAQVPPDSRSLIRPKSPRSANYIPTSHPSSPRACLSKSPHSSGQPYPFNQETPDSNYYHYPNATSSNPYAPSISQNSDPKAFSRPYPVSLYGHPYSSKAAVPNRTHHSLSRTKSAPQIPFKSSNQSLDMPSLENYPPPPAAHKSSYASAASKSFSVLPPAHQSHIIQKENTVGPRNISPCQRSKGPDLSRPYVSSQIPSRPVYSPSVLSHRSEPFAKGSQQDTLKYNRNINDARSDHVIAPTHYPRKSLSNKGWISEGQTEKSILETIPHPYPPHPGFYDYDKQLQRSSKDNKIQDETPISITTKPGSSNIGHNQSSLVNQKSKSIATTPKLDIFASLEAQLKKDFGKSKRSQILGKRYIRKLELQYAFDRGENVDDEELPYYEGSDDSDEGLPTIRHNIKFKSLKDRKKERIFLKYASLSDDSGNELHPDDDASDFEQSLIDEIKSLDKFKRSRRQRQPSDSSTSKESVDESKSTTRRRRLVEKTSDSSSYSANSESESICSSSEESDVSSDSKGLKRKRRLSGSSASELSDHHNRRVTRTQKKLRLKDKHFSDSGDNSKKSVRRNLGEKKGRREIAKDKNRYRKSKVCSESSDASDESSDERVLKIRRKRRAVIESDDGDDSTETKKRRKNDPILEKIQTRKALEATRRDVVDMKTRQAETQKEFLNRLKSLPETPLRYSWRKPSFVSSFKKGWQADLRKFKLTVARTPKSLVTTLPSASSDKRRGRYAKHDPIHDETKEINHERSTGFVMQQFFSKVVGESLGDDDSIPRPPLSPCSNFTPTGLTPTPSVEPAMLIPSGQDCDRDSLANLRDPSPPMSDSAALQRRSIVTSLMKKLQSHTTGKKSRLSDIHWLTKSKPIRKPDERPQKLITPLPLKSREILRSSRKKKKRKVSERSQYRSIFGEDPLTSASTPSPKLDFKSKTKLPPRKKRFITIYYTNSAPSTPTTPVEAEDGNIVSSGAHSGKKRKMKKFRSGFDYIPKKKKKLKEEEGSSAKKRTLTRKKVLWPEDSRDVAGEVRSWVINKGLGETLLHKAARLQYHDVIVYCLETLDPNVNARDNAGYTPLHEACNRGHIDIVQTLLAYGARVNAPGYRGMRPLHEACDNGHLELVRLLLTYGADINLTSYGGHPCQAVSDDACGSFLESFSADIKGRSSDFWSIGGPASLFDSIEDGNDCLTHIMADIKATKINEEDSFDGFMFESSSAILPRTYFIENCDGQYMLLNDLLEILQITENGLIIEIGCIKSVTIPNEEIQRVSRSDGVALSNSEYNEHTVFVKYTKAIQEYLSIDIDFV